MKMQNNEQKRKFRWDLKYLYWGITAFAVLVFAIIAYLLLSRWHAGIAYLRVVSRVLSPIIYGLIIAYLFSRPVAFFERRLFKFIKVRNKPELTQKLRRIVSVFTMFAITIACVIGVLWILLPRIYTSLESLVLKLPDYFTEITGWVDSRLKNPSIKDITIDLASSTNDLIRNFLNEQVFGRVDKIFVAVTSGIIEVLKFILSFLIGLIVAIYVLYHRETFAARVKKGLYAMIKPERVKSVLHWSRFIHRTCGSYIYSRIIDALIICVLTSVACLILRLPYALLIGMLVGITNIIPFFGPFLGAIPSALILLLESPPKCLIFVILIVVIQQVDGNLIYPRIQGNSTGISGFWVLFSVMVFGGLFGFWGFLLGVPIFTIIYHALGIIIKSRLEKRGLPKDDISYTAGGVMSISTESDAAEDDE